MRKSSVTAFSFLLASASRLLKVVPRACVIGLPLLLSACASQPFHDTPPPMPGVVSPEAGAIVRAGEPVRFEWSRTGDTESYDFHVFNAENSDIARYMKTGLLPADVCVAERCSINLYLSLPESNRHAWRVRASNMAGKSAWTRTLFTFVPAAAN